MPTFQQNVMNRHNLYLLENQDFHREVNIFYKDMQYPIYDFNRICPAPNVGQKYGSRRKNIKLEEPLSLTYRNYLFSLRQTDHEPS
jgi:hypothetical protein